jgi:hypothetical protein
MPRQATNVTPQVSLVISSTSGGAVAAPGEGTFVFDQGISITVTAVPDPEYRFTGWAGTAVSAGKVGNSGAASTTVFMDADYTLQAQFTLVRYKVTIMATVGGQACLSTHENSVGTGWANDATVEFDSGTQIDLTATPEPGYHFTHWSGTIYSSTEAVSFQLLEDTQLQAHFEPDPKLLAVDSAEGGSVVAPGEGEFLYAHGTLVTAVALPDSGYRFAGWSGTLMDDGQVADPNCARIDMPMMHDGTLYARFAPAIRILYVDDDAIGDPGPNDPTVSDPGEDGSLEHPFDTIQEAIDAAETGDSVLVLPGLYPENIDLNGKGIVVSSMDRHLADTISQTRVDGSRLGSVVSFTDGGCSNAVLAGLTIVAGDAAQGGGIYCSGASPVIANCVITGCRATSGGGLFLAESRAVVVNCTVSDNYSQVDAGLFCDGDILVVDSIIWGNLPKQLHNESDGRLSVMYTDIQGGWPGQGNIDVDPHFALPGCLSTSPGLLMASDQSLPQASWPEGDYHLRSETGRWDPVRVNWVVDPIMSPCIDRGNPARDPAMEPAPHGGRINMGAFGGTRAASMSMTGEKTE